MNLKIQLIRIEGLSYRSCVAQLAYIPVGIPLERAFKRFAEWLRLKGLALVSM